MAEVYLYGNTRLPKLPDRDTVKYPYAFIFYYPGGTSPELARYRLYFLANKPVYSFNTIHDTWQVKYSGEYQSHQLRANWGADWTFPYNGNDEYGTRVSNDHIIIWTSADILKEDDGSVVYPGSDPVAVDGEWEYKKSPMYLYSGHSLPKLLEWDKTTYPYAVIRCIESYSLTDNLRYVLFVTKERPAVTGNVITIANNGYSWTECWALHDGSFEWDTFGTNTGVSTMAKSYALWTNTDILNEDGTVYLAASAPVPFYGWETLWEGEKQNDISGDYGKLLWLWDNQSTTGVNILSVGDLVRVTVDGTVYFYTVQATQYESAVEAGNKWLGLVSGGSTIADDGTDFYFFEMYGGLRAYTRAFGTHSVKFERAITDIPVSSIHTARVQGWLIGRRLAAMRVKREPVAYLYNGVRLPKLPEYDTRTYPYALINFNSAGFYSLRCFTAEPAKSTTSSTLVPQSGTGQYILCTTRGEEWGSFGEPSNFTSLLGSVFEGRVWTNFDLCTQGSDYVWLAASDPVPVYE